MKYSLFFILVTLSFFSQAQTNSYYSQGQANIIKGNVIDEDSNQLLPNCNVFISNSSIGAITDAAGKFTLYNIPDGSSYQVIVSATGYETYTQNFSGKDLPLTLSIKLSKKVIALQNVVIQPIDPMGWDKWGDQFKRYFIGESENAEACRIENPEILKFRYNKKTDYLDVSADSILVIKNKRLGYVIKYQLEKFTFDIPHQVVKYLGYPLFEELETDTILQAQYKKRRMKAYNGSIIHFMHCVYNNSLAAEGYKVQRMEPEAGYSVLGNDGRTIKIEITDEPTEKKKKQPKQKNQKQKFKVQDKLLKRDDILFLGADSVRNVLSFDNFLYVIYNREPESGNYNMFPEYNQMSKLSIINDEKKLLIQPDGKYYPPLDLLVEGYMGWEKIGDLLPLEYQLPKTNKNKKTKKIKSD